MDLWNCKKKKGKNRNKLSHVKEKRTQNNTSSFGTHSSLEGATAGIKKSSLCVDANDRETNNFSSAGRVRHDAEH
jgi:hypothetical protein